MSDCISFETILEAQNSNCPSDVKDEIRELWSNMELGNDYYYYSFYVGEDEETCPKINEYLKSRGVETCLIHFWW